MFKIISSILVVLFLSDCNGDLDLINGKINFIGLTTKDENGVNTFFDNDSTDWRKDDVWKLIERNLFTMNYQSNCTTPYNFEISGYPNPCNGEFRLDFKMPSTTNVEIRVVDRHYKTLVSADSIMQNIIGIDVQSFRIKDTIRVYYKFIENNCEFRGHGDILIE